MANFEYLAPFNFTGGSSGTCTVPAADALSAGSDLRQRLWRYSFEGLLVIPNTPLIVGLSANVSAQHPSFPEPLTFLRQTTCASSLDSASMPADWSEF